MEKSSLIMLQISAILNAKLTLMSVSSLKSRDKLLPHNPQLQPRCTPLKLRLPTTQKQTAPVDLPVDLDLDLDLESVSS